MFTAYDADEDVFRAIRDGARGYLLKGSPAAEIAQAIRQVHAGESYLSPRIAAKLVKGVTLPRGRTGLLSARERGVLRLVAAGLSNRQIGETLSISERTVKFHVTAIFNKLGAENRAQAVALAAERGLLAGRSSSRQRQRRRGLAAVRRADVRTQRRSGRSERQGRGGARGRCALSAGSRSVKADPKRPVRTDRSLLSRRPKPADPGGTTIAPDQRSVNDIAILTRCVRSASTA